MGGGTGSTQFAFVDTNLPEVNGKYRNFPTGAGEDYSVQIDLSEVSYIMASMFIIGKDYYGSYGSVYLEIDGIKQLQTTNASHNTSLLDVRDLTGQHTLKLHGNSKSGNGQTSNAYGINPILI